MFKKLAIKGFLFSNLFIICVAFASNINRLHDKDILLMLSKMPVFKGAKIDEIKFWSFGVEDALQRKKYKVKYKDNYYVLRFMRDKGVNYRKREIICAKNADQINIGPKVYYASVKDGVLLMEYVDGVTLLSSETTSDKSLEYLAENLNTFHYGPSLPKVSTPFEKIRYYRKKFKEKNLIWAKHLLNVPSNTIEDIEKTIKPFLKVGPSHNNLNPAHILRTGCSISFIDWDYSGQSYPIFDVTTAMIFLRLNPERENTFLKHYIQAPIDEKVIAKVYLMKQITLYYYAMKLINTAYSDYAIGGFVPSEEINKLITDSNLPSLDKSLAHISSGRRLLTNRKRILEFAMVLLKEYEKNILHDRFQEYMKILSYA